MLNIQQRAKRAAARKNNKLAKSYPLFAEQFAVTTESQIVKLEKQEVDNDKYFENMLNKERERYERAMKMREVFKANVSAEIFAEQDARAQRIYGNRGKYSQPEYSGAFYAAWWWQCIREFVPSYAQANCPNSQFHEWEIYQAKGECPTCKTRLTKHAPNVGDSARQLSFIQPQALSAPQALSTPTPRGRQSKPLGGLSC
jgi:hypothetical protein